MKRFSTAERFWKDTLELVIEGNGEVMLGIPSELFDIMELSGEHSRMPLWQREELESDLCELSSFWGQEKDLSASDVLINALSSTLVTQKALDSLSQVLAECTMVSPSGGVRMRGKIDDVRAGVIPETGMRKDEGPAQSLMHESEGCVRPSEIYEYLRESIVSQKAALRCASMIMYDHFLGRRSVSVFAGPTG
ncbi:MAG: hypothetical protein J5822_01955, partial [Eubacteriaceae bacterium]|nr:hypothetical protein [Eubacteriaceae bacterium]